MDYNNGRSLKQSVVNVNYLPPCPQLVEYACDDRAPRLQPQLRAIVGAVPNTCPEQLDTLANLLVRDLPSYANRIIQTRRKRTDKVYSSIEIASRPELQPLDILSREYTPNFPQAAPTQIFVTTLERQYTGVRSAQLQQFHWLFIAKTRLGWRLVNIYTRTGGFPLANNLISPPVESSKTIVGTAVAIWLNDCYLGRIRS
ncbi:hypothetical protein [Chamaesiphon sp.]|uniref:hypothetical protein n=1 Tax=Chamaesiphon sp. TaxID=2814140 RepID=UPI0035932441